MTTEEKKKLLILYFTYDSMKKQLTDKLQEPSSIRKTLLQSIASDMKHIEDQFVPEETSLYRYLVEERGFDKMVYYYLMTFIDFNRSEASIYSFCGVSPNRDQRNFNVSKTLLHNIFDRIKRMERYSEKYAQRMEILSTDGELHDVAIIDAQARRYALKQMLRDIKRAYDYEQEITK